MTTYTIGEVADRSGFSASALRYYEGIGLVEPTTRTSAGYRIYDDHTLARLAFISRAKQLGCSLEEITDLAGIWDGEHCGPVQRGLHDLVTAKIRDADERAAELRAFTGQLHAAADQLRGAPVDGPCTAGCACLAACGRTDAGTTAVPVACTLEPDAMSHRTAEWTAALAHAGGREVIDGGLRIDLGPDVDLGELGRLIAAEQHCCSFFDFTLRVAVGGTALEVRAPELAGPMVTELFGRVD